MNATTLANIAADCVVLLHLSLIVWVVAGGLLVLRYPTLAWLHVPAVLWGALIEFGGWICPLTPLENWLRRVGGGAGYSTGFVEHYVVPLIYPSALTRDVQIALGTCVLLVNALVYGYLLLRRR